MNEREKLRSESLNLLRFPLAVVVLIIHVFNFNDPNLLGQEITPDTTPIFQEICYFIDGFLRGQSVPIYFFISGYVFFLGITLTRDVYKQKLRNRVKTLLIPFLIWETLALLPWAVTQLLPVNFSVSPPSFNYVYPQNLPLWFIRDLMIVVIFTPAIYWLLTHTRHYVICLLGLTWFALTYWDLERTNQLVTAFFFFSWGAYMSVNKKDMLVEFGKFARMSVVLYLIFSMAYVASMHWFPDASTTIKRLNIFIGLPFAYNFASWLLRHKICTPNTFLTAASFFIYISHWLIFGKVLKLIILFTHPATDLEILAAYIATILLTLGILLSVFWLLRRYAPNLLKVVAGRK